MSLTEQWATERRARLVRLGARAPDPIPDHSAERIRELTEKLNRIAPIIEELHAVIVRQREVIRQFADESEVPLPRMNDVIMVIAEYYNVTKAMMIGSQRTHAITTPRFLAYYLCRKLGYSLPSIGRACNKDHTSVLHGAQRITERLETEPVLSEHIAAIEKKIFAYVSARIELSKAALA